MNQLINILPTHHHHLQINQLDKNPSNQLLTNISNYQLPIINQSAQSINHLD